MAILSPQKVANQRSTPGRWKRRLRWAAVVLGVTVLLSAYAIKDHVRTLRSLHRLPGTNAYTLDYYVDYNIDEIRVHGIDVNNVEDSFLSVFFPDVILSVATRLKSAFISRRVQIAGTDAHRCTSVVSRDSSGDVLFGRNFDWTHDACLILKIHQEDYISSIAVIDLAYLNLDGDDLHETNLIERIPLLFAPYYVMDGMNRSGVTVADMSQGTASAPYNAVKPDVLHSTAMRLILDYAETTEEALEILQQYNIHFAETKSHLMIADRQGVSVVVEFIDGEMKTTYPETTWQVCTNHRIFGKSEEDNDLRCDRYRLASNRLAAMNDFADSDDIWSIMKAVSMEDFTMWTTVYNLTTGEVQFAYRRKFQNIHREQIVKSD